MSWHRSLFLVSLHCDLAYSYYDNMALRKYKWFSCRWWTFLVTIVFLQLYGGIQRYLEQFPDGGFFKGKNFVFDHRYCLWVPDISRDLTSWMMLLKIGLPFIRNEWTVKSILLTYTKIISGTREIGLHSLDPIEKSDALFVLFCFVYFPFSCSTVFFFLHQC